MRKVKIEEFIGTWWAKYGQNKISLTIREKGRAIYSESEVKNQFYEGPVEILGEGENQEIIINNPHKRISLPLYQLGLNNDCFYIKKGKDILEFNKTLNFEL